MKEGKQVGVWSTKKGMFFMIISVSFQKNLQTFLHQTWKMIRNYNKTYELNMQYQNTENCLFLMQEGVKTRSFRSKGKDKDKITVVPLTGNRMQTRQSKSKQIGPEKKVEIPTRCRREKK